MDTATHDHDDLLSPNTSGTYASLTIGADGLGLISYVGNATPSLKVAHCVDVACSTSQVFTLDTNQANYTAIATGADGLGAIVYGGAARRSGSRIAPTSRVRRRSSISSRFFAP